MSADGQLIAFQSEADNLAPNDTNGGSDVFVYNRLAGTVTLVSVAVDGTAAGGCSRYSAPVISPDGRYVAFECGTDSVTQLVPGKWGDQYYLRDLVTGTTTLLTPNASGVGNGCANMGLHGIMFTGDSRHVLFVAADEDAFGLPIDLDRHLTADPITVGAGNIFERNLITNETRLVSADRAGKGVGISPGGGAYYTVNFTASDDGRFVTFISDEATYVDNDANNSRDVFVRDVQRGTTAVVSCTSVAAIPANDDSGIATPSITADGRYVAFVSAATDLASVNPAGGELAYVRDMQAGVTTAVSLRPNGTVPDRSIAGGVVISANGRTIVFSDTASLLPSVGDGNRNVYAYDQVNRTISLVSVNAAGSAGANADAGTGTYLGSSSLVVSPDGRHVFYRSAATNVVGGVAGSHQNLFERDLVGGASRLVTVSPDGSAGGAADSDTVVVSSDGRYVAFQSRAPNLVADDGNHRQDVFVRDMTAGVTQIGSKRSGLLPPVVFAENGGRLGSASADGRYVVFTTTDGTNGPHDFPSDFFPNQAVAYTEHVALRDTVTGTISFLDVDATGTQAWGGTSPMISADGKFVYFMSTANLDAAHPNTGGSPELYYRDLTAGTTTLVSRSTSGGPADGNLDSSGGWSVSADGRHVVWTAEGTSMVSGMADDSGGFPGNVFIFDRMTGIIRLVSHSGGGTARSGNGISRCPIVSDDGTRVVFVSLATDLVSGATDTNGAADVFSYDVATGRVSLVSASTAGAATGNDVSGDPDSLAGTRCAVSGDGRYVFFASNAANLVENDGNNRTDVFRRDLVREVTTLVSSASGGSANDESTRLSISSDGSWVAFQSRATDLLRDFVDNNGDNEDVFVRHLGSDGAVLSTMLVSAIRSEPSAGGNGDSNRPVLSPDGCYVAFTSAAVDLVPGFVDANGEGDDLFVADLRARTTVLVTANQAGTAGGSAALVSDAADTRRFSANGTLFFNSTVPDLAPGDRNRNCDIFSFTPAGAGIVSGKVFGDTNGSGTLDQDEAGLRDWTVYLDTNDNGMPDSGEARLQTDASGSFAFNDLAPGSYTVRVDSQAGLTSTPACFTVDITVNGQVISGRDFAEQADRGTDLAVTAVSVPDSGRIGGVLANVRWTVANNGTATNKAWQDAIYLSTSPSMTNSALLLATVEHVGGLPAGGHYDATTTVALPAVAPGSYYVVIQTDRRVAVSSDANPANNMQASGVTSLDVPMLAIGADYSNDEFAAVGQVFYYKIVVPGDSGALTVDLASLAVDGGTSLYLRHGQVPTPWEYDLKADTTGAPDQNLANPITPAGVYYVMVRAECGAAAATGFTLHAALPTGLRLESADRAVLTEGYTTTVAIRGLNLSRNTTARLVSGTRTIAADRVAFKDSTAIFATFDLPQGVSGDYSLQVVDGGQTSATLPMAIAIPSRGSADHDVDHDLVITLQTPTQVRHHGQVYYGVLEYSNNTPGDIVAPIIVLGATNARLKLPEDANFSGDFSSSAVQFLGISQTGPSGLLRPGETGRQVFCFQPGPDGGGDFTVNFSVDTLAPFLPIDWASEQESLRPSSVSSSAWNAVYGNLTQMLGTTTTQYTARLAQAATYLGSIGAPTGNLPLLWSFLLAQADARFPTPVLASVVDSLMASPGLPLAMDRAFLAPISSRYRSGMFGLGWASPWDTSLAVDGAGDVTIVVGGSVRLFARQPDGSYEGGAGDHATLVDAGGIFTLTEVNGTRSVFRANGTLDYRQDANGNRLTVGYDGNGRMISLTHSGGQSLALSYNGAGLVSQVHDSAGRTILYSYETDGRHLTTVAGPDGVTHYQYDAGGANELTAITAADGTHRYFTYDPSGRLAGTSYDGGAASRTFAYLGDGEVSSTDAYGNTSTTWFTLGGQVARMIDANGHSAAFQYDADANLVRAVNGVGAGYDFAYDTYGSVTSIVNPLGHAVSFVYGGAFHQATQVTDARGHATRYGYDSHGNLLAITYPGGGQQKFAYDPSGNLTETINRRSNATRCVRDSHGRLTRVDFADHTSQAYAYDEFDNLISASSAGGTIVLHHADPSNGRLTEIDYPEGLSLAFAYDAGGRRVQSVDQGGFVINYSYDAVGRLSELQDGSGNLIVRYAYDNAGRLAEKHNGNGTVSRYTYDAVGQVVAIDNFQPDGVTRNSFFTYAYDAANNVVSSTGSDGTTTYAYDAAGQLVLVSLPAGRTVAYAYDAAGNRTRTVDSLLGTTTCTFDGENEVTTIVGPIDTTTNTYDADGNLQSVVQGADTTTYAFNDLNQLTGVSGPAGTSSLFTYDALGNRASMTSAGQTTSYVWDPSGIASVVGAYGPGNTLIARYVHGLGLVRESGPAGTGYYDFDVTGNTVGISAAAGPDLGKYINTYSYLPFGETASVPTGATTAPLANPFTFVGQAGVMQDDAGLLVMRNRLYSTATGQFISNDPLSLGGGDLNLRRYAENSPLNHIDPTGLWDADATLSTLKGLFDKTFDKVASQSAKDAKKIFEEADKYVKLANDTDLAEGRVTDAVQDKIKDVIKKLPGLDLTLQIGDSVGAHAAAYAIQRLLGLVEDYEKQHDIDPNHSPFFTPAERRRLQKAAETLSSYDPNAMLGPAGVGSRRCVSASERLPYTIEFENTPAASGPAQEVFVTHHLDPRLDYGTFELGSFGFGSVAMIIPAGLQQYATEVAYRNADGTPLKVHARFSFDQQTGLFTVALRSIDPATGGLPTDALAGFLPPEDDTKRGQGFVQYTVRARSSAPTGAVISQQASIVFDGNAAIGTPIVTNTIDAIAPASTVAPLPAGAPTGVVVSWGGNDDALGSGIAAFDVLVSDNGGPYTRWQEKTTLTSAPFPGVIGHTYEFKSIATDSVGNVEMKTTGSDATVTIVDVRNRVLFDAPTGTLVVGGTSAADAILLASAGGGATATLQVTLNKSVISRTILLSAVHSIRVLGQERNDTITVTGLAMPVSVEGGDGNDTIALVGLAGPATVDGGAGSDKLKVSGRSTANAFALNATSLAVNGLSARFSSLENLAINGGKAADTLTVAGLPGFPVAYSGGGGGDGLQGPAAATAWAITGAGSGTLAGTLAFTGIANLAGGAGADTFMFSSSATLTGRIDGGGGDNTLDYGRYAKAVSVNLQTSVATGTTGFANIQSFVGGARSDALIGRNQANRWTVTGVNAGTVNGTTFAGFESLVGGVGADTFSLRNDGRVTGKIDGGADTSAINSLLGPDRANLWALSGTNGGGVNATVFARIQNLTGGGQDDAFVFAEGAKISGSIDGGEGRNRLDYAGCATAVVVDLSTGRATGTAGVAGIQDVTGGSAGDTLTGADQDNVLIGGRGNDTLSGNGGRDVLIGGDGLDGIVGGDGEDLIIGGKTSFDANWVVLNALRRCWLGGASFAQRTQQLAAGTTNSGVPVTLDASSVINDAFVDRLTGGRDADWFLAKKTLPPRPTDDSLTDFDPISDRLD